MANKLCNTKLHPKLAAKNSNSKVGRPKSLNERDVRLLLRTVKLLRKTSVNFSVKDVIQESGLDQSIAK